ncbi:phosphatidate cytidylyltransferase [Noviherbaspirillum sedimenti]|uniref:Phosphatidate cytidylyltransferase n=1 Tax=Noviherbaspirillum sedimenti TaxID=2320865 RepID=A0A3A3FYR3_9BURK|nr:phosphatidate cytidylyltransferase [Noviherbaspirillum sedimenti]RJG00864.1 phosphatidate cytidylyltransferase [Noviherbaspirillum sedimenti]
MLKTRVITALALLALLLLVVYSGSFLAFVVVAALFLGAAMWEALRLFGNRQPLAGAAIWTLAFCLVVYYQKQFAAPLLFAVCAAIWLLRLVPALKFGLPPLDGVRNRLLAGVYCIAILGCFVAILQLYQYSPLYLLSVMAIVWVADIGAYFSGRAFGKRKLAPSISPGKSWEGAFGGWLAVLLLGAASALSPALQGTFPARLQASWGWGGWLAVMSLLVAASVVGDLCESQLKRRAGMKDSSNLLPGHGGVLDRIDALIPVLPLAMLFHSRF